MFLKKIITILATEIKWVRIALLALGAAMVAILVSGGAYNMLSLTIFSLAGIFIARLAPKHPFLNAFCYGLLGTLFYVTLLVFQALGQGQEGLLAADVFWLAISVAIVVLAQSMIGAWIGTSIRKFSRVAAEARKEREAAADKKDAGKKPASPKKKGASARQRKKKG